MHAHAPFVLGFALLLTGCGELPTRCSHDQEPTLEVGTGAEDFASITDGQVLPAVYGLQGGQHVWVGLRLGGLVARVGGSTPATQELRLEWGDYVLAEAGPVGLSLPQSGGSEFAGYTLILNYLDYETYPDLYPADFDGSADTNEEYDAIQESFDAQLAEGVRLWARVTDRCGVSAEDEVMVGVSGVAF